MRDFVPADAEAVDALGCAAFAQFVSHYDDWPAFARKIAHLSQLGSHGEIVIAERANEIVGAVAYIGPDRPKAEFFRPEWPLMRMLVVSPKARGLGVGRALAENCVERARRDGAKQFALHTSEIMTVALPMYRRMGFYRHADAPAIHGVPYGVWLKDL